MTNVSLRSRLVVGAALSLAAAFPCDAADPPRMFGFFTGEATVTTSPYYPPGTYDAEAAVAQTPSGIIGYVNIVFDPLDGLGGTITHAFAAALTTTANVQTVRYGDRICGAGDPVGKCYPQSPDDVQYSFEGDAAFVNGRLTLETPVVLPGLPYAATLPFDIVELTRTQNEPRTSFDGTYANLEYIWMGTIILPTPLPLQGSNTVEISGGEIVSWIDDGGFQAVPGIVVDWCFDDAKGFGWSSQQGVWHYFWSLSPDGQGVSVFTTFDDEIPDCADLPDPLAGSKLDRAHDDLVGAMFERTAPATGPGVADELVVTKNAGSLDLSWQPDCGTASRYAVYRGDLAAGFDTLTPEDCSVNGTGLSIPEGAGQAEFFVVAPNRMNREGSFGLDSRNARRPHPSGACFVEATIDSCAP